MANFLNTPHIGRMLAGLFFLFGAFEQYFSAMRYDDDLNGFPARSFLLACLLPLLFTLGWWFAGLIESLALSRGQSAVFIAVCVLLVVILAVGLIDPGSLFSRTLSFWKGARFASISILLSGLSFRLSLLRPEAQAVLNRSK